MARQKNCPRALIYLSKAAGQLDSDVALDNLDLVASIARQGGAAAVNLAAVDRLVRQIVISGTRPARTSARPAGATPGCRRPRSASRPMPPPSPTPNSPPTRAKSPPTSADLVLLQTNLNLLDGDVRRRIAAGEDPANLKDLATRVVTLQTQVKALRDEVAKLTKDNDAIQANRKDPPHADKLVMSIATARPKCSTSRRRRTPRTSPPAARELGCRNGGAVGRGGDRAE